MFRPHENKDPAPAVLGPIFLKTVCSDRVPSADPGGTIGADGRLLPFGGIKWTLFSLTANTQESSSKKVSMGLAIQIKSGGVSIGL
jgi:hypothetical protein